MAKRTTSTKWAFKKWKANKALNNGNNQTEQNKGFIKNRTEQRGQAYLNKGTVRVMCCTPLLLDEQWQGHT